METDSKDLQKMQALMERSDAVRESGLSVLDAWGLFTEMLALAKRARTEGLSLGLLTDAFALLKRVIGSADAVRPETLPAAPPLPPAAPGE